MVRRLSHGSPPVVEDVGGQQFAGPEDLLRPPVWASKAPDGEPTARPQDLIRPRCGPHVGTSDNLGKFYDTVHSRELLQGRRYLIREQFWVFLLFDKLKCIFVWVMYGIIWGLEKENATEFTILSDKVICVERSRGFRRCSVTYSINGFHITKSLVFCITYIQYSSVLHHIQNSSLL